MVPKYGPRVQKRPPHDLRRLASRLTDPEKRGVVPGGAKPDPGRGKSAWRKGSDGLWLLVFWLL